MNFTTNKGGLCQFQKTRNNNETRQPPNRKTIKTKRDINENSKSETQETQVILGKSDFK